MKERVQRLGSKYCGHMTYGEVQTLPLRELSISSKYWSTITKVHRIVIYNHAHRCCIVFRVKWTHLDLMAFY
jgi:hypothetical protein